MGTESDWRVSVAKTDAAIAAFFEEPYRLIGGLYSSTMYSPDTYVGAAKDTPFSQCCFSPQFLVL